MSTECKLCNLRFYIRKLAVSELKHNVYPLIRENFARTPIFYFVTWLTPRVKGEKATLSAAVAGDQNTSPSNMLLWHKDCLKELSRMPKKLSVLSLLAPKKDIHSQVFPLLLQLGERRDRLLQITLCPHQPGIGTRGISVVHFPDQPLSIDWIPLAAFPNDSKSFSLIFLPCKEPIAL